MLAINHALTGAVIGLTAGSPVIAIPAAIAPHFVCDAIPHFGTGDGENFIKTRRFAAMLLVDALLCGVLVLILGIASPANWLLAAICAFAAAAPDFSWLSNYISARKGSVKPHQSLFNRFAKNIQWFERPIGSVVEVSWFVGIGTLFIAYL